MFASIKTVPAKIASKVCAISPCNALELPPKELKKIKYVGALSKNLNNEAVCQKYMTLFGEISAFVTGSRSGAMTPDSLALKIAAAVMIVIKIPAKSFALARADSASRIVFEDTPFK